jgi:hypothetical protein
MARPAFSTGLDGFCSAANLIIASEFLKLRRIELEEEHGGD